VDGTEDHVLVVALPRRHLGAAEAVARDQGRVTIPAGGPGDLDRTPPGTEVLVIVTGPDEVPASTWHAVFVERLDPPAGTVPDGLPPTWVEEHGAAAAAAMSAVVTDEDNDDDDRVGPQAFFVVEALAELPKHDWVFANELVRKQDRGGRAFVPRAPRLIRRPA
jgi:hypothetical protein